MKKIIFSLLLMLNLNASSKFETSKTTCILQSNYNDTTLNELKKILIDQSKQEALEELYGNIIYSKIEIKDGKLISDEIRSRAIGAVRISGNPNFYNGKNLGEICADVKAYITKKDLQKYSPKEVILTHYCYTNKSTALGELKNQAKQQAYIEMITSLKPSLKYITFNEAEKLVSDFSMTNEKFDISSSAYCFDAKASLMPYELEMIVKQSSKSKVKTSSSNKKLHRGLKIDYYAKDDFELKTLLYSEISKKNSWYKNKKIANKILKSDKIYRIHIQGYLKTDNDSVTFMKLIQDVYSVKIKLNEKEILTDKRVISKVDLKPNTFYKLDIMLKTAQQFDIALLIKKHNDESYQPIGSDYLFN
jgi:hypothetical protein